jgi:phosphotransferase system  glucose/maltose/N-acetylglucosamine-specific IIC component
MKTRTLPAVIMLVAGFIDCILAIINHQSLWEFTRQLLLVLLIFYAIGCVVQIVINMNFKEETEDGASQEETEESLNEAAVEETQEEEEDPFPDELDAMEDIQSEAE